MLNDSMDFYDMYRSRMTGPEKMNPLPRRKTPRSRGLIVGPVKLLIGRCLNTCGSGLIAAADRLAAPGIIEKRRPAHV